MAGRGRSIGRMGLLAILVALLWSGVCAAQIANPSFEQTYDGEPWPRPLPYWWDLNESWSFNSYCSTLWSTDGGLSACLCSCGGVPTVAGDFQGFYQFIDLTDVDYLIFDAMLLASDEGGFGPFAASFEVTSIDTSTTEILWVQSVEGEFLDQVVDVSAFTGMCVIELRLTALVEGTFNAEYAAFWDNLGFYDGPSSIGAYIDLAPDVLDVGCDFMWGRNGRWGCRSRWITCFIQLEDGFDPTQIDGSTVFIEDIPAYVGREWWARPQANWANVTDINRDGIPERMVKFDRDAVEEIVEAGEMTLAVGGLMLDGTVFEGTGVLQVIDKGRGPHRRMCRPVKWHPTWRFHRLSGPWGNCQSK